MEAGNISYYRDYYPLSLVLTRFLVKFCLHKFPHLCQTSNAKWIVGSRGFLEFVPKFMAFKTYCKIGSNFEANSFNFHLISFQSFREGDPSTKAGFQGVIH